MGRLFFCATFLALILFAVSATAADTGKRYALIIGINDYELLGKLECAREDAEALADVLVQNCGFDPARLCLIADNPARGRESQPTFTNIKRRLQFFTSAPEAGDSLLVYFAGHGVTIGNEGFLMPADGNDEGSGFAMGWLRDRLNACKATNKILILDACHSGKLTRGVSGIAPTLATTPSVLVLASCKDNEISYPEGKHGVFTAALLAGLGGKADKNQDKQITGTEFYAFVREYMEQWTIRTAKIQTPQMNPPDAAGIVIATLSPRPSLPPVPSPVPLPVPAAVAAPVPAVAQPAKPDPKLLLAKVYQSVADDLVRGDAAAAAKHARDAQTDYNLSDSGKELSDLALQVGRLGSVPDLVMASFARDKGKEVKVELRSGTESMQIDGVAGRTVSAKRIIRTGSGSMQAACTFGYADLSPREKARRLAVVASGPDAALLNGMLALEDRQTDQAGKLFATSATELGKALAARLAEPAPKAEPVPVPVAEPAAAEPGEKKLPPASRAAERATAKADAKASEKASAKAAGQQDRAAAKSRFKPATPAVIEAAMEELKKANPDEPDLKYRYTIQGNLIDLELTKVPGKYIDSLVAGNKGLSNISALAGLPLVALCLNGSAVTNLSPLTGMPLERLYLQGVPIESLKPLEGMQLRTLYFAGLRSKVTDFTPLKGMPIRDLALPPTFRDVDAQVLAGMPLEILGLGNSQVTDVSWVNKLPLRELEITFCRNIRDISPLRGMPLKSLTLRESGVVNLDVLSSLKQLTLLGIGPEQLPGLAQLRQLPQLHELYVNGDGEPIAALEPLAACSELTRLQFTDTSATISGPGPFAKLRNLKTLVFLGASLDDVSGLAVCKSLEELTLPPGVSNVDALRKLPNLKTINGKPAGEFWKEFAAANPGK